MNQYTIYDNPLDYPGKFVVRKWIIGTGAIENGGLIAVVETLEQARAAIPLGLILWKRHPQDDPKIVETWF